MLPKIEILGVRVDKVSWKDIEAFCRDALSQPQAKQIITVNGEFILEAQKNSAFKAVINQADLVIPDSTNIVLASRWRGRGLLEVTPGSELVERLARLASKENYGVFLLGGRGEVARQATQALKKRNPNLKVAGFSSADPEDPNTAKAIKDSGADIVLVAYGAPKQDLWIAQNKEQTGAKLLMGVGGTFDMLSGRLPRAPKWLRHMHLEWLWRLILQPSRFKRTWRAVVIFPLRVVFS